MNIDRMPHFANMRDGALVSLKKPASQKMVDFTNGVVAFGVAAILCLLVAAYAAYPEPLYAQGMIK